MCLCVCVRVCVCSQHVHVLKQNLGFLSLTLCSFTHTHTHTHTHAFSLPMSSLMNMDIKELSPFAPLSMGRKTSCQSDHHWANKDTHTHTHTHTLGTSVSVSSKSPLSLRVRPTVCHCNGREFTKTSVWCFIRADSHVMWIFQAHGRGQRPLMSSLGAVQLYRGRGDERRQIKSDWKLRDVRTLRERVQLLFSRGRNEKGVSFL